jgi:uncharacterized protein
MALAAKARDVIESGFTEPVRDPLWGHIHLTEAMRELLRSAPFVRLSRIRQLGPTHFTYPGATHSRYGHSLGVLHVARAMLRAIIARECPDIFSPEGLMSFLVASLLHDLGHFPYTHSLKELPLAEHEALTGDIVAADPFRGLVGKTGADPDRVAAIVDGERPCDGETTVYRNILSGVLDPDKLDYLNRDAYYCGVPYGTQDLDFVLSRIALDPGRGLSIDAKGVPSIEHLLFSKYMMYRSVYWHRDVRAATSMVKKGLFSCLAAGDLAKEDLYALDDESFRALANRLPGTRRGLITEAMEGRTLACAQEIPYDPSLPSHGRLASLEARALVEERMEEAAMSCGAPRGTRVVIDLPEAISFETELVVTDTGLPFNSSSGLFTRETIKSFTQALRIMRIYASAPLAEKALRPLSDG